MYKPRADNRRFTVQLPTLEIYQSADTTRTLREIHGQKFKTLHTEHAQQSLANKEYGGQNKTRHYCRVTRVQFTKK